MEEGHESCVCLDPLVVRARTHLSHRTHILLLPRVQPYLKSHNLRTYEDFNKPVPNFRAMTLKAGEVPRFFDGVLSGRVSDAVAQVGHQQHDGFGVQEQDRVNQCVGAGRVINAVPCAQQKQAIVLNSRALCTQPCSPSNKPLPLLSSPAPQKDAWWAQRKTEAERVMQGAPAKV